ncbi:MAG: hypothetical protein J6W82_07910, partial [Bacteroidales bacterium]|nr:hypothetical protein [Bacteroidales bacterium]
MVFLLSVFTLLAGIGITFPEDGLKLGGATLLFPSPKEVAESLLPREKEPEGPSPEELLAQRMAAIHQAEQNRFDEYITESPSRIHFPGGDVTLFDPFFEALDSARSRHMRILHYGDSQLEEDRITSTIRNGLQERFGGGGPGLLPFGRP